MSKYRVYLQLHKERERKTYRETYVQMVHVLGTFKGKHVPEDIVLIVCP